MITKILNRKKIQWWKKFSDFDFFIGYRSKTKNSIHDFFKKSDYKSKEKKFVTKKITKFDYIFDTKIYILYVVYDKIVNKKSFESLSIKFVILQTKEICQFLFDLEIVDNSKNARNEIININENRSIASNAQTLITRTRIRFSFSLKNVFSMMR